MKLCIRAHDLGVKGTEAILSRLEALGLDGVQMVCYKAYDDIAYLPGGITREKARAIGKAFAESGHVIPLVGAYFNPVHSDKGKVNRCFEIYADYLKVCQEMGCNVVGSETGSFNDDKWTYHPQNRTEEALQTVKTDLAQLPELSGGIGYYRYRDALICQQVLLESMLNYMDTVGVTRGSALYYHPQGQKREGLEETFRFISQPKAGADRVQTGVLTEAGCAFTWRAVRPMPQGQDVFETVWRTYRENKNIY